ncbi:DNA alkylation repair protein [Corynebacterium alimapuense]|uniref:DNA alkylation repair protein n=1 Tax=Corynebacterium alimapuense TaxID=1576874 RepID=A0A3M8K7R7_9CORY|nr:DNA alkylation repair protein [Corynebacterium alimapuense]RNE48554.1 DNA alkylation repair protein [Corynebacterium alimapuense]
MTDSFALIQTALRPLADPTRAKSMSAYLRGRYEFLGITTPARRAAVSPILRTLRAAPDWNVVTNCWAAPEREYCYVACDHLQQVPLQNSDLPRLKRLVIEADWWDCVDLMIRKIGSIATAEDMRNWAADENSWVRRVAILHQLRLREATDHVLLAELIDMNLGSGEFFIDKAIGWALRDYSGTNPDWVREFLATTELSTLSRRQAAIKLPPVIEPGSAGLGSS